MHFYSLTSRKTGTKIIYIYIEREIKQEMVEHWNPSENVQILQSWLVAHPEYAKVKNMLKEITLVTSVGLYLKFAWRTCDSPIVCMSCKV